VNRDTMKIYMLRSKELSRERFRTIYELVNSFDGPIKFIVQKENTKYIDDDDTEENHDEVKEKEENADLEEYTDEHGEIILPWSYIFGKCQEFRKENRIKKEELVVLFTDYKNKRNFFSAWDPSGIRNFFITTSMWGLFTDADSQYPIISELASLPLALAAFDNMEEMEKWGHEKPRGCAFDYCKNKTDVRLRLRTGDICPDCNDLIKRRGIDSAVAKQIFKIFDVVREQALYRDRFSIVREPSRLNVNMIRQELIFTDIGNTSVHLGPKEMTLYCLILNHSDGIYFKEMIDHKKELITLYKKFSNYAEIAILENRVKALAENKEKILSELVSRINRKIKHHLGEEIAAFYGIKQGRGAKHVIPLNRDKVSYTEIK